MQVSVGLIVCLFISVAAILAGLAAGGERELPISDPPRGLPTLARFEYSVPTGLLQLDAADPATARGPLEDLLRLDHAVEARLARLAELGAHCTLRTGSLAISWTGPRRLRGQVEGLAQELHDAFVTGGDPSARIGELLRSPSVGARRRLARLAARGSGPSRQRVLHALMRDPDPDLAWEVTAAHGTREDWLEIILSPHRPPELRGLALSHLPESSPTQRCELATALAGTPALHREVCRLLDGLEGEHAEAAWLVLAKHEPDREILEHLVTRLGQVGTIRSLPALHTLRERVGLLRFHLRELTETAIRQIRERSGATPGALSLIAETGQLAVARRDEP
jgi:hypothetical protein